MPGYRPRGGHPPVEPRSFQAHTCEDFYDDRRSRSRSPDRRHSSPTRRRTPPYDIPRAPRGPGYSYNSGRRSPSWRHNSRGRDDTYSDRRSPSPRGARSYHDRDRPYDEDQDRRPRGRDRTRTPSRDRSSSRGRPSKEVMMDGLAPHLTESDISAELKQHYHVHRLDDVRIIRDRQTKQSRQFGFLRFPTLEEAQDFMDRHYPTIYLYGDSSKAQGDPDDSRVRLSYGKERRDTRPEDTDWICSSCNVNNYATRSKCFRCQTPKSDAAAVAKIANIGDNDASPDNTPSQFLLIRGLEASVSEEVFAKGIAKLNKPTGITGSSTSNPGKKGAKVASTTGDANLGAREGTLRRVLLVRDRRTNDSWRYGFAEYASIEDAQAAITRYNSFDRFTIASKHVLVSYIHAGVFVPVINPAPSVERFLFSPLNNPSLKLAYWDEDAYVTELVVFAPDSTETDLRTGQAKLADSEGLKSSSAKEKNNAAIRKRKAESSDPSTTKKPAPSHLQFWSNRHAELHGIKSSGSANGSEDGELSTSSTPLVATTQSFADPVRHCCYLCMRQFNDAAEVNAHERVSELHRANLRNKAKLQKALAKLSKHGVAIIPVETDGGEVASEYRDRAKERRKVYGVVNKKGKQVSASKSKPKSNASSSDAETPAPSKGAALLSKMGYTAGQGLGASGEGRKEVISQDVYAPGVGLGAQGGKMGDAVEAAERSTKGGFQDWLDQGRERARERYQGLE